MTISYWAGVDPGLVHTGVVVARFNPDLKDIKLFHELFPGLDASPIALWLSRINVSDMTTYIEGYRPRAHLSPDKEMVAGVANLHNVLRRNLVLDNMGVKKVVTDSAMRALDMWNWHTSSHHQDLRSAARIMLLGMYRDDEGNQLIYNVLKDGVDGNYWNIVHKDRGDTR